MAAWRRFVRRLYNVLRPAAAERNLAREIEAHVALLEDGFRERGMDAETARRAARLALGGVDQTKEQHRDARSFLWLDDSRRDLLYSARLLRRNPLFAATAALSLAIGIGANTTIFTVANALLFRPPAGVLEPGRLVDIGTNRGRGGLNTTSYPAYLDVRDRATLLDGVYAVNLFPTARGLTVANGAGGTEVAFTTSVTANYFSVLGAGAAVGRLLSAADGEPNASPVVVLSYDFWARRFNHDGGVVGTTLRIGQQPFTVVGVASQGFHGTGVRAGDLWLPMNTMDAATLHNRAASWLFIGARLKPGVAVAQAASEVDAIGRALAREYPDQNRNTRMVLVSSSPVPGNTAQIAVFIALLVGIVSAVLVAACANIAGMLLARAAARRREIAVRLAIGAGRARLVRQLLTETLMLFSLGGAAGLALARGLTSLVVSLLPALPFPVNLSLALDGRAMAFTMGLTFAAALLAGLAPAFQASHADVVETLKDETQAWERLRLRQVFVAGQVTLSILLVVVAGLFARALQRAGSTDPGFDPHGVELASLDLEAAGYTDATAPLFARQMLDRVRALGDVQAATMATVLPGGFERLGLGAFRVPDARPDQGADADGNVVEPGYFTTLRMPFVAGRDFTADDRAGAPLVAIVGEGAVRRFWPGQPSQNVIDKLLLLTPSKDKTLTLRVVGVVRDPTYGTLVDRPTGLYIYVPMQQQYVRGLPTLLVARSSHGQRIGEELRTALVSMNPNVPIVSSQTADDYTALGLMPQRVAVSVAGSLGVVGLLLAAIGIYGVTAYSVARRTREIGIRIALGAPSGHVIGLILRQGMSLVAVGGAMGLLLAVAAGRLFAALLLGLPPTDPVTFTAAIAVFAAVGIAASYLPVRRATRVNPMEALRHE